MLEGLSSVRPSLITFAPFGSSINSIPYEIDMYRSILLIKFTDLVKISPFLSIVNSTDSPGLLADS